MSKTKKVPLGEIVNFTTGKLDSNVATKDGLYPFFICAKEIFKTNTYAFDCEAILLSGNNASGDFDVKLYNGKFDAYQRTYVITIKNDKIIYKYLKIVLENKLKELKVKSSGSLTKYLTLAILIDIQIPFPPLDIQQKIAARLEKADELRRMRRYAIEMSERFLQEVFIDMFGDFLVKDIESTLQDVILNSPNNGFFSKNDNYGSGLPIIWVDDLYHTNVIDINHLRMVNPNNSKVENFTVTEGDLLFTRSSLVREGIGQINIVPKLNRQTLFECHLIRISVKKESVNPYYILGLYRSKIGKSWIIKRSKTSTMTTINQEDIVGIPCPIPPIKLQNEYGKVFGKTYNTLMQQREALRQSELLFSSLLNEAFEE